MPRTARVKITPETLLRLQAGKTVIVRLPKDVRFLHLSTVEGDIWERFGKWWEEFDLLWKKFPSFK